MVWSRQGLREKRDWLHREYLYYLHVIIEFVIVGGFRHRILEV